MRFLRDTFFGTYMTQRAVMLSLVPYGDCNASFAEGLRISNSAIRISWTNEISALNLLGVWLFQPNYEQGLWSTVLKTKERSWLKMSILLCSRLLNPRCRIRRRSWRKWSTRQVLLLLQWTLDIPTLSLLTFPYNNDNWSCLNGVSISMVLCISLFNCPGGCSSH